MRPPSSASQRQARRGATARVPRSAERGGPGRGQSLLHPPPGREMEREKGARARARRPSRAGRERGFSSCLSHPPPPPRGKHLELRRDGRVPRHARETRHRARTPPPPPPRAVPQHPRLGQGPDGGGVARRRTNGRRRRGAEALPRRKRKKERRSPPSGDGQRDLGRPPADLGYRRRPPPPLPERARPRAPARQPRVHPRKMKPASRVGPRRPAAPAVPPRFRVVREKRARKEDKPLCRGLTLNRSQRGSCSATYETPTQKQVVYEWFSARFHTNVRST